MTVTALLVTRDASLAETFSKVVATVQGCRPAWCMDLEQAMPHLDSAQTGVVVLHVEENADDSSAPERLMQQIASTGRSIAVLVVVDVHRADQVMAMLRAGVVDCLPRPLDLRRTAFLIDSITLRARYRPQTVATREPQAPAVQRAGNQEAFLYGSGPMTRVVTLVKKVARHDAGILLTGETGTGKSRTARLVHELSPRAAAPFLAVNCAVLPETLIESELFGHRRGAFTGADVDYAGRFAQAGEGTLFLDEIDALPLASQAKLLRAVDERVFEQVGSSKPLAFKARLIVATNHSLEAEVQAGRFRADLYYRLNVIEIPIPPLRLRRSEIRHIAESQIQEIAARNHRPPARLGPGVVELLEAYDWPGNIRELRNVIERALAFCEQEEILVVDLPEHIRNAGAALAPAQPRATAVSPPPPVPPSLPALHGDTNVADLDPNLSSLAQARLQGEFQRICQALENQNNNRTEAARELGISRTALYKKLRHYNLLETTPIR